VTAADGVSGELRVGYQLAARLGRWSIDLDDTHLGPARGTLRAAIVDAVPFWIDQRPFTARLQLGPGSWLWAVGVTVIDGSTCTMQIDGQPEVKCGP
jgi:hypothetical protein